MSKPITPEDVLNKFSLEEIQNMAKTKERLLAVPRTRSIADQNDYEKVCQVCRTYVTDHLREDCSDDLSDQEHFIFEAAMEMVYGPTIWDIFNE